MITVPTVLVLGAGASKPFSMPSGLELTRELIRLLDGNGDAIARTLIRLFGEQRTKHFRNCLLHSRQQSVDAFLEQRGEFRDIGKAAIAAYLLPREQEEVLLRNETHWYDYLLERVAPRFEDVRQNQLRIVTFNYDRTLEHYLFIALQQRFNKSGEEIATVLKHIPIVHVYGSLGALPHQGQPWPTVTEFGGPLDYSKVLHASEQIRIMDERLDDSPELRMVHEQIKDAARVIFLGFGYDRTNVRRLLSYGPSENQVFFGSAHGFTNGEVMLLSQDFRNWVNPLRLSGFDNVDGETLSYLRKHVLLG